MSVARETVVGHVSCHETFFIFIFGYFKYTMSTTEQEDKKLIFEENERVLCYHGPLIYEAKVKKKASLLPPFFFLIFSR